MGLGDCIVDSSVLFMGLGVVYSACCSVQCSAHCSVNIVYSILKYIVCGGSIKYTLNFTLYKVEFSVM